MAVLFLVFQHGTWSPNQSNESRNGNKIHKCHKGKNKAIHNCRWRDMVFYLENPKVSIKKQKIKQTNKQRNHQNLWNWVQQVCRIQDKHIHKKSHFYVLTMNIQNPKQTTKKTHNAIYNCSKEN